VPFVERRALFSFVSETPGSFGQGIGALAPEFPQLFPRQVPDQIRREIKGLMTGRGVKRAAEGGCDRHLNAAHILS
tara:strand:- start:594 stop:821 length:228 start_codon:yes stop_codon:yes gene_type:complete